MRIAYITNARIPTKKANGIQIMENCSTMSKLSNIDIELVSAKRARVNKQDPFEYYNFEKTFEFKRIFCIDFLFLSFLKFASFVLQVASFAISSFLYVLVHKKNIDVVYTRDFYAAAFASFLKPVFYEVHSLPSKASWLHKLAWRKTKGLIVISNGLRDDLIKYGVDENKILVARDGVNIERFDIDLSKNEAREKLGVPMNQNIIVYTGHLYEWKGADTLAQAGLQVSSDVHVYLIGGTDEDVARFRAQYKSDNLHIIGHRAQTEIPVWLKAADLLVIPNSAKERISSHYTSPLKLFEYMSSGVPIIASDLPSIREVLNDNEAVFFSPDDSSDLSEKITQSIENIESLGKHAQSVKEKVYQYSWKNRAKRIVDIILNSI